MIVEEFKKALGFTKDNEYNFMQVIIWKGNATTN